MKPAILAAMPLPPALLQRLAEHYTIHGPLERLAPEVIPAAARRARALITLGGLPSGARLTLGTCA